VQAVVTWGIGLVQNILAAPIMGWTMKIPLTCCTAKIWVYLDCLGKKYKLTAWLQSSHTDPDLARILPIYLLNQGSVALSSIVGLPRDFLRFASSQDIIGWDNFLLGMASMHLRPIQYSHLLASALMLNVDNWMTQFISKVLHLTHGQWIYRNISKYHEKLVSIQKTERRDLLLEIDCLIHVSLEEVPEESKFLLEVDFARLQNGELTIHNITGFMQLKLQL
jgi:hypothetical protein